MTLSKACIDLSVDINMSYRSNDQNQDILLHVFQSVASLYVALVTHTDLLLRSVRRYEVI